jgi:hypothetical protein
VAIRIQMRLGRVLDAFRSVHEPGLRARKFVQAGPAANPQVAQRILGDRTPLIARQTAGSLEGLRLVALDGPEGAVLPEEDFAAADEESAYRAGNNGIELVAALGVGYSLKDAAILLQIDIARCIEADVAGRGFFSRVYQLEAIAGGLGHAAVGSNPERARGSFGEAEDLGIGQSLRVSETPKLAAVVAKKAVVGADPEVAHAILQQAFDVEITQSIRRSVFMKQLPLPGRRRGTGYPEQIARESN